MTERTTCAVIGGGPAGIILGLLLARAGVEVTVLEKHGDFLRDFRGDTVHPSTLRLLDDLGLGQRFAQLPQSKLTKIALPLTGDDQIIIGNLGYLGKLGYPYSYMAITPQWDFLNLLAEAAKEEPTFSLRMKAEMTDLIRRDGRVAGVRYRTADGKTHTLRADLTVACDGRWSPARRQAGLRPRESTVPIDTWWFRLPRYPHDRIGSISPRTAAKTYTIAIPRDGYYQVAYLAKKGTDAQLRDSGIDEFRRVILGAVPEFSDRMHTLRSMDDVKHLDVRLNRLSRWHVDGLLCLGDAAHAMSPIGGVGINLAVQDAVAAATLLARPLLRKSVTTRDLDAVRRRRILPTIIVQRLQHILHRLVIVPTIEGRRTGPPKAVITVLRRLPWLSAVPAYLIGVGPRPERAPAFARRQRPDHATEQLRPS